MSKTIIIMFLISALCTPGHFSCFHKNVCNFGNENARLSHPQRVNGVESSRFNNFDLELVTLAYDLDPYDLWPWPTTVTSVTLTLVTLTLDQISWLGWKKEFSHFWRWWPWPWPSILSKIWWSLMCAWVQLFGLQSPNRHRQTDRWMLPKILPLLLMLEVKNGLIFRQKPPLKSRLSAVILIQGMCTN